MKQFIKTLIFFSGFASLLYLVLLFFWGSRLVPTILKPNIKYPFVSSAFTYTKLQEVKDVTNVDILFIGSSHTLRGIDTRRFESHGLKVFNLATSAQTPLQTLVLVKRYLKSLNPKLIVFDVFPGVFSNDGTQSGLDIIANDKNDIYSLAMAIKLRNPKVFNTFLYKSVNDLMHTDPGPNTDLKSDLYTYIKGGYVETKINLFKADSRLKKEWTLRQQQLRAFNDVISYLESKNRKFILINTPVTSLYYKIYYDSTRFDSIMNKSGKYYNFNTLINLDDSLHFMDPGHLNKNGANAFTDTLITILKGSEHL